MLSCTPPTTCHPLSISSRECPHCQLVASHRTSHLDHMYNILHTTSTGNFLDLSRNSCRQAVTAASPLSHKPCTFLSSARSLGTPRNCQGLWARMGKQTPMRHGSYISSGQASPQPGGKKNTQSAALCNCFLHFGVIRRGTITTCVDFHQEREIIAIGSPLQIVGLVK